MKTVVEIEYDSLQEDRWVCPDNIQLALEACCSDTNTKFKVKKVEVMEMLTKFKSVDELVSELGNSKFPLIGIPYTWTFGGIVKIDTGKNVLIIKDKEYPIVINIVEKSMVVISVPGA